MRPTTRSAAPPWTVRHDRPVSAQPATPLFFVGAMSPYSWFAAERIERLLPQAQWRGAFAGAIFKANGRVSWGLTERRDEGIADCEARAKVYGLGPIRWPEPWPTNDLLIARAMIFAAHAATPSQQAGITDGAADARHDARALALAAMRLAFVDGADLGEEAAVLEAGRRAGIGTAELSHALTDPRTKDALRSATDDTLALGVFGVPTIVIGDELFWGDDRVDDAVAAYSSLRAH
jgi:2-hydroxychromene-2-carboxylate isomerase